jgi:hypothetical protein
MMNVFGAPVLRVESRHVIGDCLSVKTSPMVCVRSSTLIVYFRVESLSTAVYKCFPSEHAAITIPSMPTRELTFTGEMTWTFT